MKTNLITFDDVVILKKLNKEKEKDKYGNPQFTFKEQEVFCNIKSIDRNQFYNAGTKGYKLSYAITINDFEWNEATTVIFENKKEYEVVRTYDIGNGLFEITVAEKIGELGK